MYSTYGVAGEVRRDAVHVREELEVEDCTRNVRVQVQETVSAWHGS